jgi:cytochrome c oxidase assembly factor CtaG
MVVALGAPTAAGLVTHWTAQPLTLAAGLAALIWYGVAVRRLARGAASWPVRRTATFLAGIALMWWTTCGGLQVYGRSLFWVWTSQHLLLLLVVPVLIMAGQPLALARESGVRVPRLRVLTSPLFGPALVPLLSAVLFFGPLPGWAVGMPPVGWLLQLLVIGIGAVIALPLVETDDGRGSLAIGLSLAIGIVELLVDAVPGIVLRLQTSLSSTFFAHRVAHSWALAPLKDQQRAGAILWAVAEVLDLPFLLLIFRRWIRADAREAAEIDTVLDAERIARQSAPEQNADEPWWLSDPRFRDRFRR